MQTITKRIIGITQILFLVFLGCGVCMAEGQFDLEEAIPIAPFGAIDTTTPTYKWTSVPGATIYCLLVENIDGVPLYLAWYTDEEVGCMDGEEFCAVNPEYPVDEGYWSVLPCSGDQCGRWSELAPVICDGVGTNDTAADWLACEAKCHKQKVACDEGCGKGGGNNYNKTWCSRVCTISVNACMKKCGPRPSCINLRRCINACPHTDMRRPHVYRCLLKCCCEPAYSQDCRNANPNCRRWRDGMGCSSSNL